MSAVRFSIRRLLGIIAALAVFLAAARTGSVDWLRFSYTATFLTLLYSTLAARYRGPFWYGFATTGWAYFLVAFNHLSGPNRFSTVNANLATALPFEILTNLMARPGESLAQYPRSKFPLLAIPHDMIWEIRAGINHSALTLLVALVGGRVATAMARRATAAASPDSADSPRGGPG